jgi:hypothetical protein
MPNKRVEFDALKRASHPPVTHKELLSLKLQLLMEADSLNAN